MKHLMLFSHFMVCSFLWWLAGLLPAQAAEPPPLMTLQHCLDYGVQHAPLLQGEVSRVTQSKAIFQQAKASHGLTIDAKASFLQYDALPENKIKLLGDGSTNMLGELSISRSLYSWGKWQWRDRAAASGVTMAEAQRERVYQDVTTSIARAYGDYWLREQIARAKDAQLRQADAHWQVTKDRAALGKVAKVDVMRAEVNVATARDAARRAARERESARMRLNQAMGRDPHLPLGIDATLPAIAIPPPNATAWQQHPEWQRQQAGVDQAQALVKAADADRYPEIIASGIFTGEGLTDLTTSTNWNVGFAVRMPIFDSGRRAAAITQAQSGEEAAAAQRDAVRQRLLTEMADAQQAVMDATLRFADLEATTALAQQTLHIAEERYRVGAGTSLEVFDAQTALVQVHVAVSQASADVYFAQLQLTAACGQRVSIVDTPREETHE